MVFLQLPEPEFDGERARDLADQVLAGRAYTDAARPPSLQERLFDWLAELIGDLFDALSTSGGRGLFAWVIIALFAGLIVFLLSRLLRNLDPLPARPASREPTIGIVEGMTRSQWLDASDEAARAGDHRTAIRCRHRALVAWLLDHRVVSARPGFTAGEIAHLTGRTIPPTERAMDALTDVFNATWYGHRDADERTLTEFSDLAEQVETLVRDTPKDGSPPGEQRAALAGVS